jgi:hypothetical protein
MFHLHARVGPAALLALLTALGCDDDAQPADQCSADDPCPGDEVCVVVDGVARCASPTEDARAPSLGDAAPDAGRTGGDAGWSTAGGAGGAGGSGGAVGTGATGGAGGTNGTGATGGAGGTGGTSGASGECPDVRIPLKPSPGSVARVMLVVDRSYSMVEFEDRWTPIAEASTQLARELADGINFGLTLFPNPDRDRARDPSDPAEFCDPGRVVLRPGEGDADALQQWFDSARPGFGLGTPTAAALEAAGAALGENPTGNDYILLATDGGPGCNATLPADTCVCLVSGGCRLNNMPHSCLDDARTVGVIRDLNTRGIRTMVLGITRGLPDEVQNNCPADWACLAGQACNAGACTDRIRPTLALMAEAGGATADGRYFEAERLEDVRAAITSAAGSVVPCTFALGDLAAFGEQLEVTVDGQPVPRDDANGWALADDRLELRGEACRQVRDGRPHGIEVGCR